MILEIASANLAIVTTWASTEVNFVRIVMTGRLLNPKAQGAERICAMSFWVPLRTVHKSRVGRPHQSMQIILSESDWFHVYKMTCDDGRLLTTVASGAVHYQASPVSCNNRSVAARGVSNMSADEGDSLNGGHGPAGGSNPKRDSMWRSAADACNFVKEILFDDSIVVRDDDKFSSRVLSIFLLVGLGVICFAAGMQDWGWLRMRLGAGGFTPFRPINLVVVGAVDVLYFLPLGWFVMRRVGILRTVPRRHALICCQLMIGASILTALVCVNIAIIILLICFGNNMHMLVG